MPYRTVTVDKAVEIVTVGVPAFRGRRLNENRVQKSIKSSQQSSLNADRLQQ